MKCDKKYDGPFRTEDCDSVQWCLGQFQRRVRGIILSNEEEKLEKNEENLLQT